MELQIDMAIEEMAELTKAIIKYKRKPSSENELQVWEEVADVMIMLEQILLILDISDEWLEEQMEFKINRANEYLAKENE